MAEQREAPPVGEELHLPGPSVIPVLNAAGLAVAILGLTVGWLLIVGGLLLFLYTLVRWIRDTAREIDSLPLEHHH